MRQLVAVSLMNNRVAVAGYRTRVPHKVDLRVWGLVWEKINAKVFAALVGKLTSPKG